MFFDPRDPRRWTTGSEDEAGAKSHLTKLFGLRVAIVVMFALLAAQLFRMQIIQGSEYDTRARNNRIAVSTSLPPRGLIYDGNGAPLVENVPIYTAVVIPGGIDPGDDDAVAAELERLLGVPSASIRRTIAEGRDSLNSFDPRFIKEDIDRTTALSLRQLNSRWPGADVVVGSKRSYPYGDLLGHIIGYVGPVSPEEYGELRSRGYRRADSIGKNGVEAQYEALLRGEIGYTQSEVDALGNEVRRIKQESPQPARGLVLSIDLDLQKEATRLLYEERGVSKNLVAVVADTRTGDILALVSVPNYDPNVFTEKGHDKEIDKLLTDPARPLFNHAIAGIYPPGSTFKQVTGLAALQEGVASPGTVIESKGKLDVYNEHDEFVRAFPDWATLGKLDFYGGVSMSSDVYFYYLAGGYRPDGFSGLGADRLARYARSFGLGQETGVDLPGEADGLVPDPKWKEEVVGEPWVLGDTYNYGIGQGYLLTTPLQMLNVTAAIANRGEILRPHVVKQIVDDKGRVVIPSNRQVLGYLPISDQNIQVMIDAMKLAVTQGTAGPAHVRGVAIAGKTGTAEFGLQLADGTYETTHGWFTGFGPADNPEIAIVVFVEHGGGNQAAAPLAQRILEYYFYRSRPELKPTPTPDPGTERRDARSDLGPGTRPGLATPSPTPSPTATAPDGKAEEDAGQ